jgi:hypothetical protein
MHFSLIYTMLKVHPSHVSSQAGLLRILGYYHLLLTVKETYSAVKGPAERRYSDITSASCRSSFTLRCSSRYFAVVRKGLRACQSARYVSIALHIVDASDSYRAPT